MDCERKKQKKHAQKQNVPYARKGTCDSFKYIALLKRRDYNKIIPT